MHKKYYKILQIIVSDILITNRNNYICFLNIRYVPETSKNFSKNRIVWLLGNRTLSTSMECRQIPSNNLNKSISRIIKIWNAKYNVICKNLYSLKCNKLKYRHISERMQHLSIYNF